MSSTELRFNSSELRSSTEKPFELATALKATAEAEMGYSIPEERLCNGLETR